MNNDGNECCISAFLCIQEFTLDLTNWKRCKIVSLWKEIGTVTLVVEDKATNAKAKCILEPPWMSVQLTIGCTISLKAFFDKTSNLYRINAQDGMIVTDPDYLVSGTSVVGALYCQRRGVLQERFRGVDADSQIVSITMWHTLSYE